jgi:DNA polymerase-3 subunit epsilon
MYAVIDVETTGLRTGWHDRVVELAVVRLDEAGRTKDEWCTLVNPERDLGPQHIHGISAAEARRAPRFADLGGQIVELLRGHVLVAHNFSFDSRFLASEVGQLASDPDSMSGKARKARQYGIPIVHPEAYRGMLAGSAAH